MSFFLSSNWANKIPICLKEYLYQLCLPSPSSFVSFSTFSFPIFSSFPFFLFPYTLSSWGVTDRQFDKMRKPTKSLELFWWLDIQILYIWSNLKIFARLVFTFYARWLTLKPRFLFTELSKLVQDSWQRWRKYFSFCQPGAMSQIIPVKMHDFQHHLKDT